jgi:exonuclease III
MIRKAPSGAKSSIGTSSGTTPPHPGRGSVSLRVLDKALLSFVCCAILISQSYSVSINSTMNNVHIFPKISISSINCNSLNASNLGTLTHKLKIYGITRLQTDFITLSDIRLCNSKGVSNVSDISDSVRINPYGSYKLLHNSVLNKRGVGILYKNSLNLVVLDVRKDRANNILCAKLQLDGKVFILCAIYGPNKHDPSFFSDLKEFIQQLGNHPALIAGDWNCTVNCQSGAANVDTLNMRTAPNVRHSKLLKKMCNDLELCDPFRAKFPNRLEFTFLPRIRNKNNRSRIDFFIVSNSLLPDIASCEIATNLQNKLFDHKAVFLSFKDPPKIITQPTIS